MSQSRMIKEDPASFSRVNESELLPKFRFLQSANIADNLKEALIKDFINGEFQNIDVTARKNPSLRSVIVRELAHQGNLEVMKDFIHKHHIMPSSTLLHVALQAGNLSIVKWLHETYKIQLSLSDNDKHSHKNHLIWALRKGHLSIAEWLIKEKKFSLSQANEEVNLFLEAVNYKNWHVIDWLAIKNPDYLAIDYQFRKQFQKSKYYTSLCQFIAICSSAEAWPFFHELFKKIIIPFISNKQEWHECLKLLNEKYNLVATNTHTVVSNKQTIYSQYLKLCNQIQLRYPLLDDLPDEILKLVLGFLPLPGVFSIYEVSKRYHKFVSQASFVVYKYKQYFSADLPEINPNNYYSYMGQTYRQVFKLLNEENVPIIHACLTDNIPYSLDINFDVLIKYYPSKFTTTIDYFYSTLLKSNRRAGINHFAATLLLSSGSSLHYQDYFTIGLATRLNLPHVVKYLLEKTENIIDYEHCGKPPLLWAARHGYKEIVKILIEKKANLRIHDKSIPPGTTARDYALMYEYLEIIPLLFDAYAEIPDFHHQIEYPMIWACKEGKLDLVKVLYRYNKKLIDEKDENKRTSLYWATYHNHAHIVTFLLERSPELICKNGPDLLNLAYETKKTAVQKVLVHYIYKYSQTLPCYILSKLKYYLFQSQYYLTSSLFECYPNLTPLYENLNHIISTSRGSLLNTIEMMLTEIIRVHNFLIQNHKIGKPLKELVENALIWLFGHEKYLIQASDKTLTFILPNSYWQLLRKEELNVIEVLANESSIPKKKM